MWRNLSLDRAAASALGLCVVCFTLGSSSIAGLKSFGHDARWLALLALWACAVALALRNRRLRAPSRGSASFVVATAGLLVATMLLSATWSVDPWATVEHGVSFAVLLTAAGALALGSAGRPEVAQRLLAGVLVGAGVVLAAGLLLLLVRYGDAIVPATGSTPWRFRGIGENPNTLPMIAALVVPLAVAAATGARGAAGRIAPAAVLALAVATIYASGSRGGLLGAFAGAIVVAAQPRPWTRRAAAVTVLSIAAFAGGAIASTIPQPTAPSQASNAGGGGSAAGGSAPAAPASVPLGVRGARLEDEVGSEGESTRRTLFGSSGRTQAWQGAIDQANERPLLGYGFGTEDIVFFDRFRTFQGARPENSFIGLYLQLGLVGLGLFAALGSALVVAGWRAARRLGGAARLTNAACAGAVAAGVVLMCFQSYAYAAGNLVSATLWTCAFLLPASATWDSREIA